LGLPSAAINAFSTPTPTHHSTRSNNGMVISSSQQIWRTSGTFCMQVMAVMDVLIQVQTMRHSSMLWM
jgi:hypothetical protein